VGFSPFLVVINYCGALLLYSVVNIRFFIDTSNFRANIKLSCDNFIDLQI